MSALFRRRIGSILGLLAILMATLAPTISQSLSSERQFDAVDILRAVERQCRVDAAFVSAVGHRITIISEAQFWRLAKRR